LSAPERQVSIWLVRAERLVSRLEEIVRTARLRRPPGLSAALRRPTADFEKRIKPTVGPARIPLAALLRAGRESLTLMEAADRLWHRNLRAACRGVHPRAYAAAVAGEWLTDVMIAHTGKPQSGTVAAILMDAGLLPPSLCWQTSPFFSASGASRKWCARIPGKRACCAPDGTGRLQCSRATARLEQLMKTGKGRKVGP